MSQNPHEKLNVPLSEDDKWLDQHMQLYATKPDEALDPSDVKFSETAFRIFILMASRRLKNDRFIAGEWNEEMYTKVGFKWVQDSGMKDVLGRHFPELRETSKGSKNVFAPWEMQAKSKEYKGVETNA